MKTVLIILGILFLSGLCTLLAARFCGVGNFRIRKNPESASGASEEN